MKQKRIKNQELAALSGIPIGTLNKILYGETTDPGINTMYAIAKALNCKVDDFITDENEVQTIAAHHDGEDWTRDELDEIERFKEYVKSKKGER